MTISETNVVVVLIYVWYHLNEEPHCIWISTSEAGMLSMYKNFDMDDIVVNIVTEDFCASVLGETCWYSSRDHIDFIHLELSSDTYTSCSCPIGVSILEGEAGEVSMELEMQWDGNPNIVLDIKTRVGVGLPVQVIVSNQPLLGLKLLTSYFSRKLHWFLMPVTIS